MKPATLLVLGLVFFTPSLAPAQMAINRFVSLSSRGWLRTTTPTGEMFTCSVCGAEIMVSIDLGPELGPDVKFRTNEQFLSLVKTPALQRHFAEGLLKSKVPLQPVFSFRVLSTGLTKIGGEEAFQFAAIVDAPGSTAMCNTTALLVHNRRIVKVSVDYYDGSLSRKSRSAVASLLSGLKFL